MLIGSYCILVWYGLLNGCRLSEKLLGKRTTTEEIRNGRAKCFQTGKLVFSCHHFQCVKDRTPSLLFTGRSETVC